MNTSEAPFSKSLITGVVIFVVGVLVGAFFIGGSETHDGEMAANVDEHMTEDEHGHALAGEGVMHMAVESEREFIEGMIPHHQEAIDTSREVLARGGTTEDIRTLLENIIEAQEEEITQMKSWYASWYGQPYEDDGSYEPMMRPLGGLEGVALDEAYLTDMIVHHMGAIMMARSVEPYIEHHEIEDLADAIVASQSSEISMMGGFLRELQQR